MLDALASALARVPPTTPLALITFSQHVVVHEVVAVGESGHGHGHGHGDGDGDGDDGVPRVDASDVVDESDYAPPETETETDDARDVADADEEDEDEEPSRCVLYTGPHTTALAW